jgi:y4mF family transcriptional regulator
MKEKTYIGQFVKDQRGFAELTQEELAAKAGVGLRFIRELEQGKETLKMDKVNQVLELFGYRLTPSKQTDPYKILREQVNRPVRLFLKNKTVLSGNIVSEMREGNEITGWNIVKSGDLGEYQKTGNPALITNILHKDLERVENA